MNSPRHTSSPSSFTVRKRLPPRPARRDADIYITKKTDFKAQLEKCRKILTSGQDELVLHALGAAIPRCVNLALQLQNVFHNTVRVEANTSTVKLVDDLEPDTDAGEFKSRTRQNSAIYIHVRRIADLAVH